jgi:predicted hotdog family 3-hydroxylacyl-ACP dehydratase
LSPAARSLVLDAAGISRIIPHQGSMCLLAGVLQYDAQGIRCVAVSHRSPDNPLRENGRLHAVCGVEYAAQAMAVHGALLSGQGNGTPRGGRLASLRSLDLRVNRLDDVEADLEISAVQIMGDDNNMVYEFAVHADARCLLGGKATVVLVVQPNEST